MKRLRIGPFKTRLSEQYEVSFRNGGSDVLTLDGLSENHATDISQNRQNGEYKSKHRCNPFFIKQKKWAITGTSRVFA